MRLNGPKKLGFTRRDLPELTVELLRVGEGARPDIRVVKVDGRLLVVKDYANGANPTKRLLGRYLVDREVAAYGRLRGLRGVPDCYGYLDPYALVIEYYEAKPASDVDPARLTEDFFARLRELVTQIHRRGVAHGDMRKLPNILIDRDNHPVLVDFTAAFIIGSSPMAALILPYILENDLRGICKLKAIYAPHLLSPAEREFMEHRSTTETLFRWLRRPFRRGIKKLSGGEP